MTQVLSQDEKKLTRMVKSFGCPSIVPLSSEKVDNPNQIPYLDLLSRNVRKEAALLPDAVAEFQGQPVIYFLNAFTKEVDDEARLDLQQRLANRGDHAVLAVAKPGELEIYPLNLDRKQLNKNGLGKVISISDETAPFLFQSVASGSIELPGQPKDADPVFAEIQKLLNRAVQDLVVKKGLDGLEVLSMTGRALFFRFLVDREIVVDSDLKEICPAALSGPGLHDLQSVFSSAENAAQTSAWLDETFNGDLLPLVNTRDDTGNPNVRRKSYLKAYSDAGIQSGNLLFRHLEAILRGWDQIQEITQPCLPIDWDDLKFRHIPIGVLSQVYEDFSHQVDREDSLDRSVHYTPRNLAKLLVDQSLGGLKTPHEARILDPSCGAGVFLVLALRELVRLRWEDDMRRLGEKARRPGKLVIQGILHRQIRGFDVSESALRLAALGLYVTVIELNEITRPPSEHHAGKVLQDLVLFNQRTKEEQGKKGFVAGSLGDAVDRSRFDGAFDIVVGNPPWTRLSGASKTLVDAAGTRIAKRVLKNRELEQIAKSYSNPGGIPDIPFIWRAMEWAKPGGIIAFALEARLILAQSGPAAKAREALFQAVSITGILNGSDLEKTAVWGCMDQPWLLLWAKNTKPDIEKHVFQLLTPVRENELADKGKFRLDYQSAYPVPIKKVLEYGWLCKALAMGTTLDVQVMEKLMIAAQKQSIGSFWEKGKKQKELASTRGLEIRPFKSTQAPQWLLNLEIFSEDPDLIVPTSDQTYRELYGTREPCCTRQPENYDTPLVLIRRAPGETRHVAKSICLFNGKKGFSKNFFGYSTAAHKESRLLTALLHLISHSLLFKYFTYMYSGQIGAKRRIIDKQDIDAFPFPALESISKTTHERAITLAEALDAKTQADWGTIDAFVYNLYNLTKAEQQVVNDTVHFNGPYRSVRDPAALPVPTNEAELFAKTLEQSLQPFFKIADQRVQAKVVPPVKGKWQQPWRFITLLLESEKWVPEQKLLADLMKEANRSASSRVVMPLPEGGLILGLINKRRFWTQSRARLCAVHISQKYLDACFPLSDR